METGIWENFHWENEIWVTGTEKRKQTRNRLKHGTGTGIWKIGKPIVWELGFGQNVGWQMRFYPLSGYALPS